jgi:hypothetical protein
VKTIIARLTSFSPAQGVSLEQWHALCINEYDVRITEARHIDRPKTVNFCQNRLFLPSVL